MVKRVLGVVVLFVAAAAVFIEGTSNTNAAHMRDAGSHISREWNFSAHPFMGEGYGLRPAVVTSVRTNLETLTITAVRIENTSSKPIASVRLAWHTFNETEPGTLLERNFLPMIPSGLSIERGTSKVLRTPVISFAQMKSSLESEGKLKGSFRTEVMVTEVLFADGSRWKVGDKVELVSNNPGTKFVKTAFDPTVSTLKVKPFMASNLCARQMCVTIGPPLSYSCSASQHDEFCTNCGVSCCNTICGSTPACDCT